mgnify:CR=1 FL=1|tara:strand:- start:32 stop:364 length:333 start_codon:yes stop_codon:yes gene_type:complete
MARQKLFWGAVIGAVAPLIGGMFGRGDEVGGKGDGGKSRAISDFLRDDQGESNRFVDKAAAQRQKSKDEQDRTAEELAAIAFKEDRELRNAPKGQFATKWQPIQDTLDNG